MPKHLKFDGQYNTRNFLRVYFELESLMIHCTESYARLSMWPS